MGKFEFAKVGVIESSPYSQKSERLKEIYRPLISVKFLFNKYHFMMLQVICRQKHMVTWLASDEQHTLAVHTLLIIKALKYFDPSLIISGDTSVATSIPTRTHHAKYCKRFYLFSTSWKHSKLTANKIIESTEYNCSKFQPLRGQHFGYGPHSWKFWVPFMVLYCQNSVTSLPWIPCSSPWH